MMTSKQTTPEPCGEWQWRIVQTRNRDFDNLLFFGVRSTGIYCKPSCAARRPKRENISFFETPAEAESAGFRACLRCRPGAATGRDPNAELIVRACQLIESRKDEEHSLERLAAELKVSSSHLQRTFKQALGVSPKEFASLKRVESFKREVRRSNVTTALYESGFGSSRALYEKAAQNLGMTPAGYRKGGRGARIRFATADTRLGKLLVAATDKGICAVTFGETEEEVTAELAREFPHAEVWPGDLEMQAYVRELVEHLEGVRRTLELPLELQATAFQLRVWAELRRVPYGETRSYKQIAESLGQPQAVRAVARACAANPVALLNPCHRIISASGDVSGYRWGVARKKMLLDKERN